MNTHEIFFRKELFEATRNIEVKEYRFSCILGWIKTFGYIRPNLTAILIGSENTKHYRVLDNMVRKKLVKKNITSFALAQTVYT